jgi:hypothetical protein
MFFFFLKHFRKHIIGEWLAIKHWHIHIYNTFLFIYLAIFFSIFSSSFAIYLALWQKPRKTKIVMKFLSL